MAMQNATEGSTLVGQSIETIREYAVVTYPLLFSASLFVLGLVFQATGNYIEAGVAGATGLIVGVIAIIVYVIFWLLGRYGK